MVGLVITIAQRKGGAGKTSLAIQLAVTWACRGARVAALDIDSQGSFAAWVDLRRARLGARLSVLILPHCLAGARRNGSTIGSVRRIWS
jgi:cellulose biosynthesis protein BcsQ